MSDTLATLNRLYPVQQAQAQPAAAPDPNDFTAHYNTPLSPEQEQAYQGWVQQMSQAQGRDMSKDTYDYDLRGAWAANAQAASDGHLPSEWKKPNHPTFSDESVYHSEQTPGGKWARQQDGSWTFTPSPFNLQMNPPEALQRYWQRAQQPTDKLVLPQAAPGAQSNRLSGNLTPVAGAVEGMPVGDVVPFPGDKSRPGIEQLLPPAGQFPRSFSPYFPGYDFDWHKILTPAPVNDASTGKSPLA
jgi:hypothetical protein